MDRHLITHHGVHCFHLLDHPVDELRAISGADQQSLHTRAEQPALDAQTWTALVLLGVDHVDACRGHDKVVDVCAAPRQSPVMEHAERVRRQLIQTSAESFFADRAPIPGPGRLWLVTEREDEPADLGVLGSDALFAGGSPAFELTARGAARCALIVGLHVRHRIFQLSVCNTADGLARPLVDGLSFRGQVDAANPAGAGIPQAHPLLVRPVRLSMLETVAVDGI